MIGDRRSSMKAISLSSQPFRSGLSSISYSLAMLSDFCFDVRQRVEGLPHFPSSENDVDDDCGRNYCRSRQCWGVGCDGNDDYCRETSRQMSELTVQVI